MRGQDTTDIGTRMLRGDQVGRQGSPRIHGGKAVVDVGSGRDGGDRRRTSRIWREGVGAEEHGPDQSHVYVPEVRGRGRIRMEAGDIRPVVVGPVLRRAAQRDPYPGQSCWRWLIVDGWDRMEWKRK